jgi:hypothetical protein
MDAMPIEILGEVLHGDPAKKEIVVKLVYHNIFL